MNNLVLYYVPNSKIKIEITSTNIMKFYSKYLDVSLNEIDSNSQYKMLMDINFRECVIGEYYIPSLKM